MKIGFIHASSVASKNKIVFDVLKQTASQHEVYNFGCFEEESKTYSYIDISVEVGMLIASGAIDFCLTGCSSGQGMMLACNNMPGVLCGYIPTAQDAYLFATINNGNVVSFPLGLGYGWAGELNLRYTLKALFEEPFGCGYPKQDATRKIQDTALLKEIKSCSQKSIVEVLNHIPKQTLTKALERKNVINHILQYGTNESLCNFIQNYVLHN